MQPGQPWKWPRYERGAGAYEFVMSKQGLARGLTHLGTAARLRRAMSKVAAGQNITVATIGGAPAPVLGAPAASRDPQGTDATHSRVATGDGTQPCCGTGLRCTPRRAGSITAGQGAVDGHNWVQYLENYVTDNFNGLITVANGAVPGTLSSYMSVWCAARGRGAWRQRQQRVVALVR